MQVQKLDFSKFKNKTNNLTPELSAKILKLMKNLPKPKDVINMDITYI
jgi:hypothetical protein